MTGRSRTVALTLALLLGAGGCGGEQEPAGTGGAVTPSTPDASPASPSTEPTQAPAPPSAEPTTPGSDVRTLEVVVADGQVSPPPGQVDLAAGETLRLVITSDSDSEVHAHGFEVSEAVPADTPTTIELTGDAPGVYEVELHHPDLLLLQVAVR